MRCEQVYFAVFHVNVYVHMFTLSLQTGSPEIWAELVRNQIERTDRV